MKEFKTAELEILIFEDDVLAKSNCGVWECVSDVCACNVNTVCVQEKE